MPEFLSDEWVDDFVQRINASQAYREAAATWEWPVTLVIEAEPDKGFGEDANVWADLWQGQCREVKRVSAEEGEKAPFVIRAPYSRWKEIIRRELDPIKGMMQGKLKLKGDLPTIVRYVKGTNELVNIAASVPTEFPDEG